MYEHQLRSPTGLYLTPDMNIDDYIPCVIDMDGIDEICIIDHGVCAFAPNVFYMDRTEKLNNFLDRIRKR